MSSAHAAIDHGREAALISARIDRLPASRGLWTLVARLSLGGFFEVYDLALTSLMSPLLVQAAIFRPGATGMFGVSDQATFAFLTMMGVFAGALGFSRVTDRYSRRSVFLASMMCYTAATLMMGLQDSALGVCLWRFVAGIGLGVELVVIDCYLAEVTPKALRGRVFSISKFVQMCAIPVAGFFAHFVAPQPLLHIPGWRWMALFPAVGAIVVILVRRNIAESPRWLASTGQIAQADAIVRQMEQDASRPGQALPAPEIVATNARPVAGAGFGALWQAPHRARVLMLVISTSASSIAYYGFAHWAPTLLESQGVGITKSLLYTALIGFAYPVSPLLVALFADRVERKWQIAIGSAITGIAGLLFAEQSSAAMLVALGVLITFGGQITGTATHVYRAELFPTEIRGTAVGFVYSLTRLASAVSSYFIAYVLLHFGSSGVFASLAAILFISVVVTLAYGPRTAGLAYHEFKKG